MNGELLLAEDNMIAYLDEFERYPKMYDRPHIDVIAYNETESKGKRIRKNVCEGVGWGV